MKLYFIAYERKEYIRRFSGRKRTLYKIYGLVWLQWFSFKNYLAL